MYIKVEPEPGGATLNRSQYTSLRATPVQHDLDDDDDSLLDAAVV